MIDHLRHRGRFYAGIPGRTDIIAAMAATETRVRWVILALLFFATTINYLDRIVFAGLIPGIRKELNLGNEEYGYINGAFQIAYTAGFLVVGKFIDHFGTRIGYAVSVAWGALSAGRSGR